VDQGDPRRWHEGGVSGSAIASAWILYHRIRQHPEPVDLDLTDIAGAHVELAFDNDFSNRLLGLLTRPQRQGAG
jgi:hypothetical protein